MRAPSQMTHSDYSPNASHTYNITQGNDDKIFKSQAKNNGKMKSSQSSGNLHNKRPTVESALMRNDTSSDQNMDLDYKQYS